MEYVAGMPSPPTAIRSISRPERIEFDQVCEGVQHAHLKAIITDRSNILVTEVVHGASSTIGIAKATQAGRCRGSKR